jgi:hypothetical protein
MTNVRSTVSIIGGLGCLLASFSSAWAQSYSYNDELWEKLLGPSPDLQTDWTKHFRVGALVGLNFKADFSMSGTFSVSGNNPGPITRGANHEYDDGYVRVDATGNDQNATWYFGYENAGQIIGQRLYFHSADSYTTSGGGSESGGAQVGFDSTYGGNLTRMWGGALGWELGFSWLPIKIKNSQSMSASVVQTVHSYDISGWDAPPSAPYDGSFEGPSTKLDDLPTAEPPGPSVDAIVGGSRTLNVNLYNLRLGPTLHWELHPRFAVAVSAGGALGILTGGLEYDETLQFENGSTAHNQGEVGETQLVYGGYVAGTLLYHVEKHGDFYLGLQYMPMTSATFSGDGREATLNMTGGMYISVGVNWPF